MEKIAIKRIKELVEFKKELEKKGADAKKLKLAEKLINIEKAVAVKNHYGLNMQEYQDYMYLIEHIDNEKMCDFYFGQFQWY